MQPITLQEMKAVKLMNRTDTKFVTSRRMLQELLQLVDDQYYIQVNDGTHEAEYHTLYYDTEDSKMYIAHHNGHKTRQKLRVRSYVLSDSHFLEVKNKDNHGKTKKKRVAIDLGADINEQAAFLDGLLWIPRTEMVPKIENNFTRITLVNKEKTERLTIDSNLRFHNLVTDRRVALNDVVIIELKRDSLQPSPIVPRLNQLRIFSMGFSKYCMGMALTDPSLKQNRFKERLRIVEKIY